MQPPAAAGGDIQVAFGQTILANKAQISAAQAKQVFDIRWPNDPNQLYTLAIIDNDAPYPPPLDQYSPFLHLLIVNIPGDNYPQGYVEMPYLAPNPPLDSPAHRYRVLVYLQPVEEHGNRYGRTETARVLPHPHSKRENFDISRYVKRHNLAEVGRLDFSVVPASKRSTTRLPDIIYGQPVGPAVQSPSRRGRRPGQTSPTVNNPVSLAAPNTLASPTMMAAPTINTLAAPGTIQNMRYYDDTDY